MVTLVGERMRRIISKIVKVFLLFVFVVFHQSCVLDEFKIDEIDVIHMKEDWGMDIVSPLFSGKFEFKDLIFGNDFPPIPLGEKESILIYPNGKLVPFATQTIFEPSIIIDSLYFLITGNYDIISIRLEYLVSNGCPFPLNFQMHFFNNENPRQLGSSVLPSSFEAAGLNGNVFTPVNSKRSITLNDEQSFSFKESNRIEFSTWFDSSDLINQQDTFLASYPVEISIVLYAEVKRKNEED
jgi:hypothetical protein